MLQALTMPKPRTRPSKADAPAWSQALARRREQLGMTQEEVAAKANYALSQRQISSLENGEPEDPTNLAFGRFAALARALDWTIFEMQDALGLDLGIGKAPGSEARFVGSKAVERYSLRDAGRSDAKPEPAVLILGGMGHPTNLRGYIVDSDEMAPRGHQGIHEGDTVIVNLDDATVEDGGIYVIVHDGRPHLRRFIASWNAFLPDNTVGHSPIPLQGVTVIGRAYRVHSERALPSRAN